MVKKGEMNTTVFIGHLETTKDKSTNLLDKGHAFQTKALEDERDGLQRETDITQNIKITNQHLWCQKT